VLWTSEDFMTQVTERVDFGRRDQTRMFLEYCADEDNGKKVFKSKADDGYYLYRKFIRLYRADSQVLEMSFFESDALDELLDKNVEACSV